MKNLMEKIAALADEADEAGFYSVAKALDVVLTKVAADPVMLPNKWDPAGDELDLRHFQDMQSEKAVEEAVDQSFKAKEMPDLDKKHAEVADHLRMIADLFRQKGEAPPFVLPPGKVSGAGLKMAMDALGIKDYRSWADIHAKLNFFQATKFGADSLATGQVAKSENKDMDTFQSLPKEPKADLPMFLHERK
jgi:hypothetical protein